MIGMADSIGIILPAWGNGIPKNPTAAAPDAAPFHQWSCKVPLMIQSSCRNPHMFAAQDSSPLPRDALRDYCGPPYCNGDLRPLVRLCAPNKSPSHTHRIVHPDNLLFTDDGEPSRLDLHTFLESRRHSHSRKPTMLAPRQETSLHA